MGFRGRSPTPRPDGGLDIPLEHSHQLGSLVGAPSPAPICSVGRQEPSPQDAARSETWEPGRPAVPDAALGLLERSLPGLLNSGLGEPGCPAATQFPPAPSRIRCDAGLGPRLAATRVRARAPMAPAPQGTPEPGLGRHSLSPTTAFSPEGAIFPKGHHRFRVCQRWGRGPAHRPREPRPAPPSAARLRGRKVVGETTRSASLRGPLHTPHVPLLPPSPTSTQTSAGEG